MSYKLTTIFSQLLSAFIFSVMESAIMYFNIQKGITLVSEDPGGSLQPFGAPKT